MRSRRKLMNILFLDTNQYFRILFCNDNAIDLSQRVHFFLDLAFHFGITIKLIMWWFLQKRETQRMSSVSTINVGEIINDDRF